jgi:hypothetical protein
MRLRRDRPWQAAGRLPRESDRGARSPLPASAPGGRWRRPGNARSTPSWSAAAGLIGCLVVGLLAAGCGASPSAPAEGGRPPSPAAPATVAPSPELQALIDGARREGQLRLVWGEGTSGGAEGVARLANGLNRAYGLDLNVQFTPGPQMSQMAVTVTQEFQANRPASSDVLVGYGGPLLPALQAGALERVDWSAWAPNLQNPELIGADEQDVRVPLHLLLSGQFSGGVSYFIRSTIEAENAFGSYDFCFFDVFFADHYQQVVSFDSRPILHPEVQIAITERIIDIEVNHSRRNSLEILYQLARQQCPIIHPSHIES